MKQKEALKVQKSRFVLLYTDVFKEGTVGKDHLECFPSDFNSLFRIFFL